MKSKVFVLLSIFLLSFNISLIAQDKKKSNKETVVYDVTMTCMKCQKKIEKNIAFEKGVTDMKVDLPSKTVTIEYNTSKTDTAKLRQAFEKLGYEASIHTGEVK